MSVPGLTDHVLFHPGKGFDADSDGWLAVYVGVAVAVDVSLRIVRSW